MAFGRFLESSFCLLALVAGFFIAVPLRLLDDQTGEICLLFGQVDFLEKNITSGSRHYCNLGFYSSIVNIFLAAFLICLRWCCLMKTEKPSVIYGSLMSFVIATLAWINCVVCGIFMIVGVNEWCASIQRAGLSSGCEDAQSWEWKTFHPQPLDASKFYDYFFMVEVSSYVGIALWFLVAFLSGTQLRKSMYYLLESQNPYIEQQMSTPRPTDMYNEQPIYANQGQMPRVLMFDGDYYNDDEFEARAVDYGRITHL